MSTVRGTFDVNVRPATSALRDARMEGERTTVTYRKLGETMDGVGTPRQVAQIERYERQIASLERTGRRALSSLRREFGVTERAVLRSTAVQGEAVDHLQGKLDQLSRTRATPTIDIDGIAAAEAQLAALERRLDSFGRTRATARANVAASTFRGAAAGSFAGRAVGGGGGSAFGGSGGGGGFPRLGPLPGGAIGLSALGLAIPGAQALLGGATALAGSAYSGGIGAGAVGATGIGVFGSALTSILSVAIPTANAIKGASTELDQLRTTIQTTGRNSTASKTALAQYNAALANAPEGTGRFLRQRSQFTSQFKEATQPGQADLLSMLGRGLSTGTALTPVVSQQANAFFNRANPISGRFGDFLEGPRSTAFIKSMGHEASGDVDEIERITENVVGSFMNISRASRPYFHEAVEFLQTWTESWRTGTNDIDATRQKIGLMVDDLKTWGRFGSSTFGLLHDILFAGRSEGSGMLDDLTKQMDEWDAWINRNPRKVQQFFRDTVQGTEDIASGLGDIVDFLNQMADLLGPTLSMFKELGTVLGALGPGAIPAILAGRRAASAASTGIGVRGTLAAAGGGGFIPVAGGGGGIIPVGGAMLGGARTVQAGSTYGVAREFGAARGMSPMVARGYGTVAQVGAYGAAAASRARTAVGSFARGAAPYALAFGGLAALGADSSQMPGPGVNNRLNSFASSATFGLIPTPQTYGALQDTASQNVGQYRTLSQMRAALADRVSSNTGANFGQRFIQGASFGLFSPGQDPEEAAQNTMEQRMLQAGIRRQESARAGRTATTRLGDVQGAFKTRLEGGEGAGRALDAARSDILKRFQIFDSQVGGSDGAASADARKAAGQMGVMTSQWLRDLKQANPKLKAQVNETAEAVAKRMNAMGDEVTAINGHIRKTSADDWENIHKKLGSEAQQAAQEVSQSFTLLQRQAVDSLVSMGYSQGDARNIVRGMEAGGQKGRVANIDAGAGPTGAGQRPSVSAHNQAAGTGVKARGGRMRFAGGGRMPRSGIYGLKDSVMLPDGSLAAGDELFVNRHTEHRVDGILAQFGTSLDREVKDETRPHSGPLYRARGGRFAKGGRSGAGGAWRGIGPEGLQPGIRSATSQLLGRFPGLSVTSTTGGEHVAGSYHYLGEATDVGGSVEDMKRASEWIKSSGLYHSLAEGIHNPNLSISDGRSVPSSYYAAVWAEHANHIHMAVEGAMKALGLKGKNGGRGPGGGRSITLNAPRSRLAGVPGALSQRGMDATAKGMQDRINQQIGGASGGRARGGKVTGGLVGWLTEALKMTGHFSPENLALLKGRAMQESGGNPAAVNNWDSNAAAGMPSQGLLQTIPPTFAAYKMKGHGNILNPVDNAIAAIRYMYSTYGHIVGPGGGGYSRGGRVSFGGWHKRGGSGRVGSPTLFGAGEGLGQEDVRITPVKPRSHRAGSVGGQLGGSRPIQITNHFGDVSVRSDRDIDELVDKLGKQFAQQLDSALADSDGAGDSEAVLG